MSLRNHRHPVTAEWVATWRFFVTQPSGRDMRRVVKSIKQVGLIGQATRIAPPDDRSGNPASDRRGDLSRDESGGGAYAPGMVS
jgi:hypothetical protein